MDLDGGVIHNEGRLKGWALKSRLFWALKWQYYTYPYPPPPHTILLTTVS